MQPSLLTITVHSQPLMAAPTCTEKSLLHSLLWAVVRLEMVAQPISIGRHVLIELWLEHEKDALLTLIVVLRSKLFR